MDKIFQFCDRCGGVLGQAAVACKVKRAPIDLPAAGVLCADDRPLARKAPGQRGHGGHPCAGQLTRQCQPLDDGQPDAQPGKAAGAVRHAQHVEVVNGQPGGLQCGVDHRQQRLAVGQAVVALCLIQQGVIPQHGHGRCFASGIYS